MKRFLMAAAAAAIALASVPAEAQQRVRIGFITTLSGPGGGLGADARDGFMLAVKQGGGRLGGFPVDVQIVDDGLRPETGRQAAERMVRRERIELLTGIIFSNVMLATWPVIAPTGAFYISINAGPSQLAGAQCHQNYFNAAWQNDNLHEGAGKMATDRGIRRAFILAPNYPAGRDALTGFKRFFRGEVVAEKYTALNQTDYAAELAEIRAARPDAVFFFLPGGLGINFVKQFDQAGLRGQIPLYGPGFSFSQDVFPAMGDAALGALNAAQWSIDLQTPANVNFVQAFQREYNRLPSLYASQGYDTALLMASALAATNGSLRNKAAFRAALRKADFQSVRGNFRFGPNQHPIQPIYAREVVRNAQGQIVNRTLGTVFESHQDAYASQCRMPN